MLDARMSIKWFEWQFRTIFERGTIGIRERQREGAPFSLHLSIAIKNSALFGYNLCPVRFSLREPLSEPLSSVNEVKQSRVARAHDFVAREIQITLQCRNPSLLRFTCRTCIACLEVR